MREPPKDDARFPAQQRVSPSRRRAPRSSRKLLLRLHLPDVGERRTLRGNRHAQAWNTSVELPFVELQRSVRAPARLPAQARRHPRAGRGMPSPISDRRGHPAGLQSCGRDGLSLSSVSKRSSSFAAASDHSVTSALLPQPRAIDHAPDRARPEPRRPHRSVPSVRQAGRGFRPAGFEGRHFSRVGPRRRR